MKYLQKQKYAELRNRYAVIIGWGAGLEFQKYYDHDALAFDHMIDGANRNVGNLINGITIQGIDAIEQLKDINSVLVVIYPNIESEILKQVLEILPQADTIAARLLDIEGKKSTYSADREDLLILDYLHSQYILPIWILEYVILLSEIIHISFMKVVSQMAYWWSQMQKCAALQKNTGRLIKS